jgi:hypothetical protein
VKPGKLTHYVDHDIMAKWFKRDDIKDKFGFKIIAQPSEGYAYYTVAEHRGTFSDLQQYLAPNQTLMIEIKLQRHVREGVYRHTQKLRPAENFSKQPKGKALPPGI